ncbi:MAG: GNAT family N-acetyltransferase [Pseudomonadota bacterium]
MSEAPERAVIIRPVERSDMQGLHQLMCSLADNESQREHLTVTPDRLAQTGVGENRQWRGFVAEADGVLVGYATYTQDFHIWSGSPRFSLDDIYVRPENRSGGLGEKLMRRVFDEAQEAGAYVSWTVLPDNERAIAFYQRLGASYATIGKCGWRPEK